ncbi:MAG: cupin domain-containing protein [Planctomycetota bacterium]
MDVLSEILRVAAVNTSIDGALQLPPARVMQSETPGQARFFLITNGVCRLEDSRQETSEDLGTGDFLIFGRATGQTLSVPAGATATLLAGCFHFDASAEHPLARVLPPLIVLRGCPSDHARWLRAALELVATEAGSARPGWEVVTNRLADVLLVQALRTQIPAATGWLRGLSDPDIGEALRLMHQQPAQPWTVAGLASRLNLSRSTFAERFHAVVGQPPLSYLTWWRMHRAAALLRESRDTTVASAARAVGYETEAAFGKAFKRLFGKTPGHLRREVQSNLLRPASPLQRELKKRAPFEVPEQETGLNLRRTSSQFETEFAALFKAHGIASTMYNVLRILRGTGAPLSKEEIASRLVVHTANFDEQIAGMITQGRLQQVTTAEDESPQLTITAQGLQILEDLDRPVLELHRRQLGHFTPEELSTLNRLLVKARSPGT